MGRKYVSQHRLGKFEGVGGTQEGAVLLVGLFVLGVLSLLVLLLFILLVFLFFFYIFLHPFTLPPMQGAQERWRVTAVKAWHG